MIGYEIFPEKCENCGGELITIGDGMVECEDCGEVYELA